MLLFVFGISIVILAGVLLLKTLNTIFLIVFAIGLLMIVISTFQPLSGWGTPITMKEYELLPIVPGTNIYIIKDKNGNVMYKYTKNGTEIIESQCCLHTIFREIEESEKPILKKSKVNPKRTLWAFPILSWKYVDVFCVSNTLIQK